MMERKVKKTLRIFCRIMQFISYFISSRKWFHLSLYPCNFLPIPPMRRVCTFARFIPVKRRQPGLFWSLLPLKLAKEITAARHDFIHERRREERIECENGEARLWHRIRSNSDAGAGVMRKHLSRWQEEWRNPAHSRREKERKEDKVGWINSGISLSPQDRKD